MIYIHNVLVRLANWINDQLLHDNKNKIMLYDIIIINDSKILWK